MINDWEAITKYYGRAPIFSPRLPVSTSSKTVHRIIDAPLPPPPSMIDRDRPPSPERTGNCFEVFSQTEACFSITMQSDDDCFFLDLYSQSDPNNPRPPKPIYPTPNKLDFSEWGFNSITAVHVQAYLYVIGTVSPSGDSYIAKFSFYPGMQGGIGAIKGLEEMRQIEGGQSLNNLCANDNAGISDLFVWPSYAGSDVSIISSVDLSLINTLNGTSYQMVFPPSKHNDRFLTRQWHVECANPYGPDNSKRYLFTLEDNGGLHINYDLLPLSYAGSNRRYIDLNAYAGMMNNVVIADFSSRGWHIVKTFEDTEAQLLYDNDCTKDIYDSLKMLKYDTPPANMLWNRFYCDSNDYVVWGGGDLLAGKTQAIGNNAWSTISGLDPNTTDISLYDGCAQIAVKYNPQIDQVILP